MFIKWPFVTSVQPWIFLKKVLYWRTSLRLPGLGEKLLSCLWNSFSKPARKRFQQYNMVTFIRQKSTAVQKEMSFTIPGVSSGHKQNLVILSQALKKLFIDGVEGTGQFPKDNSRYAQEKRLKKRIVDGEKINQVLSTVQVLCLISKDSCTSHRKTNK